jgi:hypothetical protein
MELGTHGRRMSYLHPHFALTQRGTEIANAVFSTREMKIADEMQDRYLHGLISNHIKQLAVCIYPKIDEGRVSFGAALQNQPPSGAAKIPQMNGASERVNRLLKWANENYLVKFFGSIG